MSTVLPAELIRKILLYKPDVRDIVRWRTVSKWFRAITYDDLLWRALYTDSPFPRPPGPSSSQSRASLERMLVKSAQLAQSWTTRPLREVSSVKIKLGRPFAVMPTKLISGRWLVGCEEARRFVLHDVNLCAKTHAHKVLWEQDGPTVSAWVVRSVSPVAGQSIVYVLLLETTEMEHKWKLFEFLLNDESGEIYDSTIIDPPAWASSVLPRVELQGGKSRFLFIPAEDSIARGIVYDTRTGRFYVLPKLRAEELQSFPQKWLRAAHLVPFRTEFTDTHIISLDCRYDWSHGDTTLIQIFTIPPDVSSVQEGKPILYLTHRGFLDSSLLNVGIMKPCVDPITGATSITLVDHSSSLSGFKIICRDLMLPKPSGLGVSEMTIHDRPAIGIQIAGGYTKFTCLVDVCDETQVRGLYWGRREGKSVDPNENQHVLKFAIDMRRDPWSVTYSQIGPAECYEALALKEGVFWRSVFDGLRGILRYVDPVSEDEIVVVAIE
ncbi:hypothetical protein OG21DRAFT_1606346 [Imleria badia]|nr:hypothetical protein OG21DRAFT_1606346 [Imleria badia]